MGSMRRIDMGGQAVFEGVMMRGPDRWAVAVRRPDGGIELRVEPLADTGATRIPVVRGLTALAESFTLGLQSLVWSLGIVDPAAAQRPMRLGRTVVQALVIVLTGLVAVPAGLAHLLAGGTVFEHGVEVAIRLGVIVGYLWGIGRLAPVRRLFEYHGAEHVAVAGYEAGKALDVDAVRPFSTRHPRCGTSFIVIVALLTSLVGAVLAGEGLLTATLGKMLLVPIAAGVGYELLRAGGRNAHMRAVRVLMAPFLAVQRFTTRRPTDDQLEVALVALRAALPARDKVPGSAAPAPCATVSV
jgi:uncharacterized protein YqhQ